MPNRPWWPLHPRERLGSHKSPLPEEETRSGSSGIRTHDPAVVKRMCYHCNTRAAREVCRRLYCFGARACSSLLQACGFWSRFCLGTLNCSEFTALDAAIGATVYDRENGEVASKRKCKKQTSKIRPNPQTYKSAEGGIYGLFVCHLTGPGMHLEIF